MPTNHNYKPLYYLIGFAVLVNFSGLFVPLMDPDAGVYASIIKTMAQRNDYVNLWFQQTDWLDKPHFPFWITAIFFKLFGYHDWTYKLPGILFVLLGAYYTFLFAKKYYNTTIALWSAFILLTAMHIIISNNDVRAEPFLTGLIIAAVYHFSNSLSGRWGWQLVAACFFSACAVMTKGIFTLIPVGGAIAGELIINRRWKELFHWKWVLAAVLVAVFITPELYCLWKQFDTHPEKTVLGSNNVSGIKFFLWESQFGRFFNTGPIKGKGDKLFFLHTLLWAFLPWALLMYAALFKKIKTGIKKTNAAFNEWFTLSGSLLTLLLFSFSGFQLPHYTNIIFPMLGILTAHFIWQYSGSNKKVFTKIQNILTILLLALAAGLAILYRPGMNVFTMFILFAAFVVLIFFRRFFNIEHAWLPYIRSGLTVLAIGLFLNLSFYPDLLRYQSGNKVAKFMNKDHPAESLGRAGIYFPSGEFYLRQLTYATTTDAIIKKEFTDARFLFLKEDELKKLQKAGILLEKIKEFDEFHVTMLTLKFINLKTRHKELRKHYLVRLL
jgi:4-amino-4-deoxy-L-arabinose transferase-like glycosyltransferase